MIEKHSVAMSDVAEIGAPPWSNEDMISSYRQFVRLYSARPIKFNSGGMRAPHAFMTWFFLSKIKPSFVVESGVWRGQGTWLIEQACPQAQIVCLDINFDNLEYRAKNASYIGSDFSLVDFSDYDLTNSLCFFDDHQNAFVRLQQMMWKGFQRGIFEDNYPSTRGDCYSLKKAFGGHGFTPERPSNISLFSRVRAFAKRVVKVDDIGSHRPPDIPRSETHANELYKNLQLYYEAPPLFKKSLTRWGDEWSQDIYPTKEPLFDDNDVVPLRDEAEHYTWMCYVKLCTTMPWGPDAKA